MDLPFPAELGWHSGSYHGFSTRVLSLKQALLKVCIFPSTSPNSSLAFLPFEYKNHPLAGGVNCGIVQMPGSLVACVLI